jgi:putative heme-binding domain-containing protein
VRFHVALALGDATDSRVVPALASIARRDGDDIWMRAAVLSALKDRLQDFLRAFTEQPSASETGRGAVLQDLGQLFGAAETQERCLDFILQVTKPGEDVSWQPAALAGIARGLQARGLGEKGRSALLTLLSTDTSPARAARRQVTAIVDRSAALAVDERAPASARLDAIGLLGFTDDAAAGKALKSLLGPHHPREIQVAAVRALSQLPESAAVAPLVDRQLWASFTPEVREAALSALTADEPRTLLLLDAIESGAVPRTALGPTRRSRLTSHRSAAVQQRARLLFGALDSGNRMQAYERLRGTVLARTGSAESGRLAFSTHCATCHSFAGSGGTLGPDLSGIRNQPRDAILLHVLVPDYEITPGYYAYVVETRGGRTLVGRLESETSHSLTLHDASGQQHVVLRGEIAAMSASPNSLMPNELERSLTEQQLADLIEFLKRPAGGADTGRR